MEHMGLGVLPYEAAEPTAREAQLADWVAVYALAWATAVARHAPACELAWELALAEPCSTTSQLSLSTSDADMCSLE